MMNYGPYYGFTRNQRPRNVFFNGKLPWADIFLTTYLDLAAGNTPITLTVSVCEIAHIYSLPFSHHHTSGYLLQFTLGVSFSVWLLAIQSPTEKSQRDPGTSHLAMGYFIYRIKHYSAFSSSHLATLSTAVSFRKESTLCTPLLCSIPGFRRDFVYSIGCRSHRAMHDT